MSKTNINPFVAALKGIINEWNQCLSNSKHEDASDIITATYASSMTTRALAAIARASGANSIYTNEAKRYIASGGYPTYILRPIVGIAEGLVIDFEAGYLKSLEEIIHGEIFGDFLEMADYLVNSGYKDAAAVIAGSTLELHLKQVAIANSIATDNAGKPKKADTLNSEIARAKIYSTLDQKNVTAWLGLRNNAAHGNYEQYDDKQVNLLISSIREFIARNPA